MVKPYSLDLRERVAARVLAGDSVRSVAAVFSVSVATVVRWSQRARGDVRPSKMGGFRRPILEGERDWVVERIAREPEVTLRQMVAELGERGVRVSYSALRNFVHREGLSFKKNGAAKRARPARRSPLSRPVEDVSVQA
jgi:transposase